MKHAKLNCEQCGHSRGGADAFRGRRIFYANIEMRAGSRGKTSMETPPNFEGRDAESSFRPRLVRASLEDVPISQISSFAYPTIEGSH